MKVYKYFIILIFSTICIGCKEKRTENTPVDFGDFAHAASQYILSPKIDNKRLLDEEIINHSEAFAAMAKVMDFDVSDTAQWLAMPAVTVFAKDIDTISLATNDLSKMINELNSVAKKENVELPVKRYAAVIWGKPESIIFCDSCMLLALNHYMGSEHPAYMSLDQYRRQNKNPRNLPYDIVEALIATQYPFVKNADTKIINRMIYEGAIIETKMRMVENAELKDALGYTEDQMKWLVEHEKDIWNMMVGKKMLFDSSETLSEKLFSPAPFSSPISYDTPGRVGRYIGYKLIKSYIDENPRTKLSDIISPEFYNICNPLVAIPYQR